MIGLQLIFFVFCFCFIFATYYLNRGHYSSTKAKFVLILYRIFAGFRFKFIFFLFVICDAYLAIPDANKKAQRHTNNWIGIGSNANPTDTSSMLGGVVWVWVSFGVHYPYSCAGPLSHRWRWKLTRLFGFWLFDLLCMQRTVGSKLGPPNYPD